MRTLVVVGLIFSCIITPTVVYFSTSKPAAVGGKLTNTPPERTNEEVIAAIENSVDYLKPDGNTKKFTLIAKKRLDRNWYVAWLDDKEVKVLINDPSEKPSGMRVLLGPGTLFEEQRALKVGVPISVYRSFIDATP